MLAQNYYFRCVKRQHYIASLHIFLSLVLCLIFGYTQAQLTENFEDGDLTVNPLWEGALADFTTNSSNQLQLNATAAGQSAIVTSLGAGIIVEREWRFWIRQNFSGSDANQSRIYLASSNAALSYTGSGSAGTEGYFLKFGEGGSADVIRFYKDTGTSTTLLASGTTLIASSFSMSVQVTRDATGNWNISIDPSGGDSFVSEMTATDGTYNASNYFGIVCAYTISNATNFFFDDIYFGIPIVDNEPPTLINANATGANSVDVTFSEALNAASAGLISNYNVSNGIGVPSAATLDVSNPALVHLEFTNALEANVSYTLAASNMADLGGNVSGTLETSFMWFVPTEAQFRDVVINEIFADPTPVIGLPNAEYVELYNTSNASFNLENWQFVNTTTVKILPNFQLAPNSYVVLCDANNTALFGGVATIGISGFSALSNTGDSLSLLKPNGELIDMVSYLDDWYGDSEKQDGGWSLELINPDFPCVTSNNWIASTNATGGTPGAINSVYNNTPDTTAPAILSTTTIGTTSLVVVFSESVDPSSFTILDLAFNPNLSVANYNWASSNTELQINFTEPFSTEINYTFTLTDLSDCSGNVIVPYTGSFIAGVLPQIGDVIFNEIMADPTPQLGMPAAEYVELYNKTNRLLDISSLKINNGTFESTVLLYPDSFIVVTDDGNSVAFSEFTNVAFMSGFPGLTDAGTTLTLKNANDDVLDQLRYTSSWYQDIDRDGGGFSLELINPDDPCSDASNWRATLSDTGGTAGRTNSVYDNTPDITPPVLIFAFPEPADSITLVFNEPLTSPGLNTLVFSVNGTIVDITGAHLNSGFPNEMILPFSNMQNGVVYSFVIENVQDCWSNTSSALTGRFAKPETAVAGDIIINEILFNARTGGRDFVELYNNSTKNISLKGWTIADNFGGFISTPDTITNRNYMMFPNDYLVLTRNDGTLQELYPQTIESRVWDVPGLPDFGSTEDVVYLIMPNIVIGDQLEYSADWQYPLLETDDGVSLERISFDRPTNDPTNWHSASEFSGFATPGFANSQAKTEQTIVSELQIDPEIFSPDNDGYQDVVSFGYKMDKSGYTGNLTIFDSEGRLVKRLMKNELLGAEGYISWDGTNEDRLKADIGIYVILFEVFDTAGRTERLKKTCVVAHRLN